MKIYGEYITSLTRALDEIDLNWKKYDGLVVGGTHHPSEHDIQSILSEIKEVRENGMPALLVCFGHQLGALEYARNVLNNPNAASEEFVDNASYKNKDFVVVKRKSGLKVGLYPIDFMRLDSPRESWWNNYEVIEGFESIWKKADNFITVQYHPEYQSSIDKPHPILVEFLNYAKAATMAM